MNEPHLRRDASTPSVGHHGAGMVAFDENNVPEMMDSANKKSRFDSNAPLDNAQGNSAAQIGSFGQGYPESQNFASPLAFGQQFEAATHHAPFHITQQIRPSTDAQANQYQFPLHQAQMATEMLPTGLPQHFGPSLEADSATSTYESAGMSRQFSPNSMHSNTAMSSMPAPGSPYDQQAFAAPSMPTSGMPVNSQPSQSGFGPMPGSPFVRMPSGLVPPGIYGPFPGAPAMSMPNALPNMGGFIHNMNNLGPNQQPPTGRTVYVGNLPAEASVDELLNLVKFGPIENVRLLPEKNCAFISFLDGGMAAAFHADASVKKLSLHQQELKIGWGKPSACPTPILMAVQQNQATRNVYLGQLEEETTEQSLRDDLARFGPIDQVKIVRDKNIGFVHFLAIGTAMKVVSLLPSEPAWAGKRINYGKDRCAYVPKSQQQNQAHNSQAAAMGVAAAASLGYPSGFHPGVGNFAGQAISNQQGHDGQAITSGAIASVFAPMAHPSGAATQVGNRTVYIGNIHPDTSTEEICNHVRGGVLQSIRFIPEKHIAFVTFVEANAALAFHHLASYSGIMIHQRRLKIGWGKHSGPLHPALAMAVQSGGSRNVYIGNIEDSEFHTIEKLRRDFGEYGETELINTLREKNCAFVNFCNLQNAIKAIEAIKRHPDYENQRIGAGKDRCGNPPRAVANSLSGPRHHPESSPEVPVKDSIDGLSSQDLSVEVVSGEKGAAPAGLGAIVPKDEV